MQWTHAVGSKESLKASTIYGLFPIMISVDCSCGVVEFRAFTLMGIWHIRAEGICWFFVMIQGISVCWTKQKHVI